MNLFRRRFTLLITLFLTILTSHQTLASEEQPKCHLYLKSGGYVVDVKKLVRATYSSQNLCKSTLKSFVCFSYFEEKDACTKKDESLVNLFLKDAIASGKVIE